MCLARGLACRGQADRIDGRLGHASFRSACKTHRWQKHIAGKTKRAADRSAAL
jgi:hypothetical protein